MIQSVSEKSFGKGPFCKDFNQFLKKKKLIMTTIQQIGKNLPKFGLGRCL